MAKTPMPLMGRLAIQLKLINNEQLQQAIAVQTASPDKKLGEILLEQGMVNPAQLDKLKKVQRDIVAKHRAKQAAASAAPAPEPGAATARPLPNSAPAPAAKPAPPTPEPRSVARSVGAPQPPTANQPAAVAQQAPAVAEKSESLGLRLAQASAGDRQRLEEILGRAVSVGASDVHIHANGPLKFRVNGQLAPQGESLTAEESEKLVAAALTPEEHTRLTREGELDLCVTIDAVGRFRTNVYRQQRGFDIVLRTIPPEPPTLEDLGLPSELTKYTNYHQGMVLVTGPAGCGKSSTLAALVNLVNQEREEHILTVEDPIEVIHPSKGCLVNQRHAGRHTASFARALRGALREDPDIIVIGELRDLETISLAMTAAETGHFVLATLHTSNAVRTINRMIGAFPSNEQDQVRTMLSESLRAVISQRLVAKADGSGRVPALEILVINRAIANLVRDQKTVQIRSAIQTGSTQGMCLLEQSLNDLVKSKTITKEEALRFAEDKKLITAS